MAYFIRMLQFCAILQFRVG